jgi:hypothetical protein
MTTLLEQAFARAAQLSEAEQDVLASWLLAELEDENAFDEAIKQSAHKLVGLANEAIEEDRTGSVTCRPGTPPAPPAPRA